MNIRPRPLVGLALSLLLSGSLRADTKSPFTEGPATVDLGKNVAEVKVPSEFLFADGENTRRLMQRMGNPPSGTEVGLIAPKGEKSDWFVVFEYEAVGYVKDDDKDKIDAAKILEGIRKGTAEANETRKKSGQPTLEVTGWDEAPHYDSTTHNLVWALRGKSSDGHEFVNYNIRLLGREGFTSATLVSDPGTLASLKPQLAELLSGFSYKEGKRYAQWMPGDKVAKVGLAALVAGGAGVAAAKLGLFAVLGKFLAKAWKLVVVAAAGLASAVKRFFGRRDGETTPS